ncbi:hypothetical protein [Roseateles chitinivorans]|uniref:hypothetical protein n=1 Tax=Roseateles chitinivorans TaxID=2917965 RepID=UPI003D67F05B
MTRSQLLALVVGALMSAGAVTAADMPTPPRAVFTSWDPALRLVERSDSYVTGSQARWQGRISLTGVLVVEFDRDPEGEERAPELVDVNGVAHFEPDARSLARLPAAKNYYPLVPKILWIGATGREALVPLIGRAAFDRLQADRASRFDFPVKLTLTELATSVECDHRDFTATVHAIQLLKAPMVARNEPWSVAC